MRAPSTPRIWFAAVGPSAASTSTARRPQCEVPLDPPRRRNRVARISLLLFSLFPFFFSFFFFFFFFLWSTIVECACLSTGTDRRLGENGEIAARRSDRCLHSRARPGAGLSRESPTLQKASTSVVLPLVEVRRLMGDVCEEFMLLLLKVEPWMERASRREKKPRDPLFGYRAQKPRNSEGAWRLK